MIAGYSHLLPSGGFTVPPTLVDNHGRLITYLRLSLTDRCNLRCRYCVPAGGVQWLSPEKILTYEELERLTRVFSQLGIKKVRITGGEPFARKGCISFLQHLKTSMPDLSLHVTTNGMLVHDHLDELKSLNIEGINLSLDTLNRQRFKYLTGNDGLPQVLKTLYGAMDRSIPLKINSVVLPDTTDDDIIQLADLASKYHLCLRFIEHMSFDGRLRRKNEEENPRNTLHCRLTEILPGLHEKTGSQGSTARVFSAPGFKGTLGIIEGKTRKFCHSCNKLRITPEGILKSCLYDRGTLNLKRILRKGISDYEIKHKICEIVQQRQLNGHVAESLVRRNYSPSMASIGG